jgi:uncharacterized Ntn-hydrolase superfamily protein
MTYSIVAHDPRSGELGVAVQSHYFSVGSVVPWVESGVGAVATQAMAEVSYGPRGLHLMRNGDTARAALDLLIAEDDGASVRQVAMVDVLGGVAAHTGANTIPCAGHLTGNGVSVQANMMERDTVPAAMLAAYQATSGDLADRLLAALDAAEAEGGDIRGRQSAAIVVHAAAAEHKPGHGRLLDLNVEDHPEPLTELRRLVQLRRAYILADDAERAAAEGDMAAAAKALSEAMQLAPGNPEIAFWAAIGAATAGQLPAARELLAQATAHDRRWPELLRRLPATGSFPALTEETVHNLLED